MVCEELIVMVSGAAEKMTWLAPYSTTRSQMKET